jgi:hypothetical protein
MSAETSPAALSSSRRWLVRGIMALATLLAIVAIFAVWANRQVLDADNWASTSTQLLENREVRTQVGGFLVDQLYDNVDVAGEFQAALPPRLDPLAGPAANALRGLAEDRAVIFLGRPQVQQAWESVNRAAAEQFVAILDGESEAVTVSGDSVILNLQVLLSSLVQTLGGSGNLVSKIPPDAGQLTILESDQVGTLQSAVKAVRGLSGLLPGLSIALFALAVFLSPGRRRRVLMNSGWCFIAAGAVVLVGRNLGGDYVVGALASTASVEPAVEAVWTIGTDMLRDVAQAAMVIGTPVVIAAWLAGPMRAAVVLRRTAAPWLRTQPGVAYGVLAAGILLVIAWGPIPATRMVLPVVLMIGLAVAGMEVLRRQVAREFPDATTAGVRRAMRASVTRAMHAVSRPGNGARPAAAPPEPMSRIEQLERLVALHDRGVLSDEELAAEKLQMTATGAVR